MEYEFSTRIVHYGPEHVKGEKIKKDLCTIIQGMYKIENGFSTRIVHYDPGHEKIVLKKNCTLWYMAC